MAVLTTYRNGLSTEVSTGLSAGWVYYERLKDDGNGKYLNLYNSIKSRLEGIEAPSQTSISAQVLYQVASAELKKEQNFLKNIFGVNIPSWDFSNCNKEDIKNLIDNLNVFLNVPDVYQLSVNKIKLQDDSKKVGTIAKITIAEFFPSYFETQRKMYLESNWNGSLKSKMAALWEKLIERAIKEDWSDERLFKTFYDETDKIAEDRVNAAIEKTLEKMFKESSDFNKGFEKKMKELYGEDTHAYSQMYDWIKDTSQRLGKGNSLYDTIYKAYKMDDFKEKLKKRIKESYSIKDKSLSTSIVNGLSKKLNGSTYATGAVSEKIIETIANYRVGQVFSEFSKGGKAPNYSIKTLGTGAALAKPDVVLVFEPPETSKITNEVQAAYAKIAKGIKVGSRESRRVKNIDAHERLSQKLKGLDGYIVYTNAKNYTLDKRFEKDGGFHSGSEITLETYKKIMEKLNKNDEELETFVGAVINTIGAAEGTDVGGAIGSSLNIKPKLERYLALDIAYFLFDDFVDIGKELSNKDVNKLHLMNLEGFYIPLSFLLYLLYLSFKDAERESSKYVTAEITPDPEGILYPNGKYQLNGSPFWGMSAWEEQRETGMEKTTIGLTFLSSFRDVVRQWL